MSKAPAGLLAAVMCTGIAMCICFTFSWVITFFVQFLGGVPPTMYAINYWSLLAVFYYMMFCISLSGEPNG